MAQNPLNLAVRFALEMIALASYSYYGWTLIDGALRILPTVAFPLIGAALWGVFAVPGDKSRSGNTVVPTPGPARLLLEVGFFAAATLAMWASISVTLALTFAAVVILHYALSYDRVMWLLNKDRLDN